MKASSKTYAVDANVILRYLLRDNEEQWAKADALMREMENGNLQMLCDPVQLAEIVWVLTSVYGLERAQIANSLASIVSASSFRVPDKDRYVRALNLYGTSVRDFGDACACAAALEECDGRLFSFDRKLSKVNGIQRAEEPAR